MLMARVKVYRISSITDPVTGKAGKQIELVESRINPGFHISAPGLSEEEGRVVRGIIAQFQSMGLFPGVRETLTPKITLVLTEEEYEMLSLRFEVNDMYDLQFKDGRIVFSRATEGV
jgi:hypothetical protein